MLIIRMTIKGKVHKKIEDDEVTAAANDKLKCIMHVK